MDDTTTTTIPAALSQTAGAAVGKHLLAPALAATLSDPATTRAAVGLVVKMTAAGAAVVLLATLLHKALR